VEGYRLSFGTVDPYAVIVNDVDLDMLTTYDPTLAYGTEYWWTVTPYNYLGDATSITEWSFTTRDDPTKPLPYVQNFDSGTSLALIDWTGTMSILANHGTGGSNGLYRNLYSSVTTTNAVTCPIGPMVANAELKFDYRYVNYTSYPSTATVLGTGDKLEVQVSTDNGVNYTTIRTIDQTNHVTSTAFANVTVELDAYSTGNIFVKFLGTWGTGDYYLDIDNVVVRETPATPIFSYGPTVIDFGTVMQNVAATAQNVTVTNTGGGTINLTTANISITGTDAAMFSYVATNLPAALAGGQSVTIPVTVTVTSEGAKTATLTINYNSVNYDVALSATGVPAGIVVIGNGTANNNLPINPFYGYTYSQSIFLQSEINVPNQRIESVYYYWNGVAEAVDSNDWTIYMGHTAATEFASTTDWIPLANLSTVFSGTIALPATAGWIEIPLTAPFIYNNTDNLVIAVDENAPSYDGSSEFFYSTAAATNRSLRYYSDSTNPDPAAPVAGTLVLAYPNVMLQLGDIPVGGPGAPILTYPADLATDLPLGGFDLTWTANPEGGIPDRYMVYLAGDTTDILESEFQWETTNTHFNPITEGGIEYNYEDVWYWTVKAINLNGEAAAVPFSYTIQSDPTVTTFPWTENFDAALTAPSGWTVVDVDGAGTNWVGSTTNVHSTPNSFKHGYSTAVPEPGQNGWLITPPITVPVSTYDVVLSWWNYNVWPTYMVYNGVKVNTTNDPNAAGWTELWSQATAASAWSQAVVSISAYAGQTVYFAFNYQGYNGDDWYVDDVSVYELTVDMIAPSITHLPVLNTPREDLGQYVVADIVDDATWNNPIGGANIYWSIDSGTTWSAPVAMTLDTAPTYYAQIPAQPLNTTVTYYIEAWDNLNNMATTSEFSYNVADPTWIWYDLGGTIYLGFTPGENVITSFGPTVLFENPFYGSENAMQLLGTDGKAYQVTTANLKVYSFDGTNITSLMTPLPVNFAATTYQTFDLSAYNLQITTPYFLVAYEDIPVDVAGTYFLWDDTYNYGTSYCKILSNVHDNSLYTLSRTGSWAIGAYVQTGASQALDAPVVTIATGLTGTDLSWTAVGGANGYKVWASSDPYAADPWAQLAYITGTTYTYTGVDTHKFFKVTALSDAPTRVADGINNEPVRINSRSVKASQAPKGNFNLKLRK